MKACVFVFICMISLFWYYFVNIILMLISFHHWNNTAKEDEDIITDDTEAMSTLHQKSNKEDGSKVKDKESSIDDIGKVDIARVEKAVEDDNDMFDGDITVI